MRSIFAAYDPSSASHWRERIPNTTILERTGAIYKPRWSGHVCRMEDGRLPKNVFYGQLLSAPQPAGRLTLRYKDVLKRDLKSLNINTKAGNNWHWIVLPGVPFYKTDEHIRSKRTSQTAIAAELIVGNDGFGQIYFVQRETENVSMVHSRAVAHSLKASVLWGIW